MVEPCRVWLRSADARDLENLRNWKNRDREFFFHTDEISAEHQEKWFQAYQARADDFMFIILAGETPAGCMGVRMTGERTWDVYNVILGASELRGSGLMSHALQAMLRFALSRHRARITLKVLKDNPAVAWYRKNGFVVAAEHTDHFCMLHEPDR